MIFCPNCGCTLPDDAVICRQCGSRIREKDKSFLKEEQPSVSKSIDQTRFRAEIIQTAVCIAACLAAIIALELQWTSTGATGFEVFEKQLFQGGGALLINSVPAVCGICALASAAIAIFRRRHLLAVTGLVIIGLCVIYGIQTSQPEAGVIIELVCGLVLAHLGFRMIASSS